MKKLLVLLLLSFKVSACPGCLGFLSNLFGTRRPSAQEIQFQKVEQAVKESLAEYGSDFKNKKITDQEFRRVVGVIYLDTVFILPPDRMKELFPGIGFTPVAETKQD